MKKILKLGVIIVSTLMIILPPASQAEEEKNDRMVNVGDHSLNLVTMGKGDFTVIFETGFGGGLSFWQNIAPIIAKESKVALYSRAGYGKSEPAAKTNGLMETVGELEALIKEGGLKPPFIFVAHSLGGHIVRTYAHLHPEEIAGMVLIDPSPEGLIDAMKKIDLDQTIETFKMMADMVPAKMREEYDLWDPFKSIMPANVAQQPDVPMVIISSLQKTFPQFFFFSDAVLLAKRREHSKIFEQFPSGSHIITTKSGHNIPGHEPQLVVDAIKSVLSAAADNINRNTQDATLAE